MVGGHIDDTLIFIIIDDNDGDDLGRWRKLRDDEGLRFPVERETELLKFSIFNLKATMFGN